MLRTASRVACAAIGLGAAQHIAHWGGDVVLLALTNGFWLGVAKLAYTRDAFAAELLTVFCGALLLQMGVATVNEYSPHPATPTLELHVSNVTVGSAEYHQVVHRVSALSCAMHLRGAFVVRNFPMEVSRRPASSYWDACTELCLEPIPRDVLKVVKGDSGEPLGMEDFVFDAASGSAPHLSTIGAFCEWAQHAPAPTASPPVAMFDLSLPRDCPAFAEHVGALAVLESMFTLDQYELGTYYPRMFVHPAGAVSSAHMDGGDSYFWIVVLAGEKRVRAWPTSVAHASFEREAAGWPARPPLRPVELTLRRGDLYFGPANAFHAVKTAATSMSVSGNYYPQDWFVRASASRRYSTRVEPAEFAIEGLMEVREVPATGVPGPDV